MEIISNSFSVPSEGDVVLKSTVLLYFSEKRFSLKYNLDFKSGKPICLSGYCANIGDKKYEQYEKIFNKIDLQKYKIGENEYEIPHGIFENTLYSSISLT